MIKIYDDVKVAVDKVEYIDGPYPNGMKGMGDIYVELPDMFIKVVYDDETNLFVYHDDKDYLNALKERIMKDREELKKE